jgi:hypothetical protein
MAIPFVPIGPGVPNLPIGNTLNAVVDQLFADALDILFGNGPQWGLFLDGEPVVIAESVVSFDYKQNYRISTYPIEPSNQQTAGGFESYNKVQMPFDVVLRFATGDTPAARQELLESAEAACASLDLMDAVTPEKVYESVNPVHMDYRRTAVNGVALIIVDMFCEQVRTTASSSFTNAQQSGTGTTANAGTITPSSSTASGGSAATSAQIVQPASASAAPTISNGTVAATPPAANSTLNFDFPL